MVATKKYDAALPASLVIVLGGTAAIPSAAIAQTFPAPTMPDLSGIGSEIKRMANPPAAPSSGAFKAGLLVPSVNPGKTAQAIAAQLRKAYEARAGEQPSLEQMERGMPAAFTDLENQIERTGFAKRDLGTAAAFAFIFTYETATNKKIPEAPSAAAARTIAVTVAHQWKTRYESLPAEEKERIYESLVTWPYLLSTFAKAFDKAGKPSESASLRQAASETFRQLFGVTPDKVEISDTGQIGGLIATPPIVAESDTQPVTTPIFSKDDYGN